ncbi:ferredoxin [Rhodococcus sp. USK13]|uniref:ferredoxin n=1 Tax=Rhodococcus sp. USK13 TaxID=2806442 RepID=UPI001BCDA3AA|nr:ferredoxin [Rhodococcus sp. USK13]
MKIHVDWNLCEGHGQCEYAAPDVFTINDDGELTVIDETPKEGQRKAVEQAVRRCPVRALEIEN